MVRLIGPRKRLVELAMAVGLMCGVRPANADFTFGTPVLVPNVNSSSAEISQSISSDGLTFYFASDRPGGHGNGDLWVSTRATTEDEWREPENLGPPVNSSHIEYSPSISADGLTLYFADYYFSPPRPGGLGGCDIWKATRATRDTDWDEPVNLGSPINSSYDDLYPCMSFDGLTYYFTSHRPPGGYGNAELWISRREGPLTPWGEAVNLGSPLNTPKWDGKPAISVDGRTLFLTSNRSGGTGGFDLWMTRRATIQDDWASLVPLPINTGYDDSNAALSADGRTLYFSSDRPGGPGNSDLWQVSITPVADFDGDGKVDGSEVLTMADYWSTDDSLCDMGPMPWGNGVVDVEDLMVLAEYIGKDVVDGTLIAHWALDETEGDIAHDSTGGNDGTAFGDPVWKSGDGTVMGALAFDGVDDGLQTGYVLNPADGPFSVLAWVKGGKPGQVFVSQIGGVNWLIVDAIEGTLATELAPPTRRPAVPPLVSDGVVADDVWHRVVFVWDGSSRNLYLDDRLVATDAQDSLAGSDRGLNIGCGANLEPGTFFSGLIDDARIYNRAVRP